MSGPFSHAYELCYFHCNKLCFPFDYPSLVCEFICQFLDTTNPTAHTGISLPHPLILKDDLQSYITNIFKKTMDFLQLPDSVSTSLSSDTSILNINIGSQRTSLFPLLQGLNCNLLCLYLLHQTELFKGNYCLINPELQTWSTMPSI